MNRRARRAGRTSGHTAAIDVSEEDWGNPSALAELVARASLLYQEGQAQQAESICDKILARQPSHAGALTLLGLMLQGSGRHRLAVKNFKKAIASDPAQPACHYNIAFSLEVLGRRDEATTHFRNAVTLGYHENGIEKLILQDPAIMTCVNRMEERWPLPIKTDELFPASVLERLKSDLFLRCALETVPLRGIAVERFVTRLRSAVLEHVYLAITQSKPHDFALVDLIAAIARQCFINEYVFAQSAEETRQSLGLKELLERKVTNGEDIPPALLAAVAAYSPLHALPVATALAGRHWPQSVAELVRQQVREPVEEADDRPSIPALTPIDDAVSLRVMQQYEENPYPRWTISPLAAPAFDREEYAAPTSEGGPDSTNKILIAGCGSGQHAMQLARGFPDAHVLAIDISLPSLAYARRKAREAGLRNIEFAQADILKMATIGGAFDRIEAVGVLHHLAEPETGWRLLLPLLRPEGTMRIGLYSETARRGIIAAQKFVAERGYRPTLEDIRRCRQEIFDLYEARSWRNVIETADFYSMSGCRDMLFNVMEHNFDIPRIKRFLDEHAISFAGFELEPQIRENFAAQFPGAGALTDLDKWQAFETANPRTFGAMYVFTAHKERAL
jgi:SAM-dependent methyltransferase/tetratricopeptide (TPR) repeat protein